MADRRNEAGPTLPFLKFGCGENGDGSDKEGHDVGFDEHL